MRAMRVNLLVDLSGTLHIGDEACPGAIAALERIRKATPIAPFSIKVRFCSEYICRGDEQLSGHLIRVRRRQHDKGVYHRPASQTTASWILI